MKGALPQVKRYVDAMLIVLAASLEARLLAKNPGICPIKKQARDIASDLRAFGGR
jgi:hypothetical protein